jgi:uncharacterized protein YecT (DUF1311 family)
MSTRDRTGEIVEVKERNPLRHRFGSYSLDSLKAQWTRKGKSEGSTPDFYVVRAVTLLEVFTRGNIAELIDHGPDYANRAIELTKNLKMDFALVQGIQGRVITLGDIVAHNVSVNSFGQMLGHFEVLLDKKPLRPILASAVDRWATEIERKPSEPIISDFDALAGRVTRLFEVRHILCHETPKKAVYEVGEIDDFLNDAIRFTKALEEVLTFEMFGLVPLTQTDMNITAGKDLKKKEEELNQLLAEIRAKVKITDDARAPLAAEKADGSWLHSLNDAEEKWLSYRNAQCDFDTYLNQGGTIRPTLWAGEASRLTESRIAELRSWLKRESET